MTWRRVELVIVAATAACRHDAAPPSPAPEPPPPATVAHRAAAQLRVDAPELDADDVERLVTVPIERALSQPPRIVVARSSSATGAAWLELELGGGGGGDVVTLDAVRGRLALATMPPGVAPPRLALAASTRVALRYVVRGEPQSLRAAHDWIVKPALARVPGVASIVSCGGLAPEIHVIVDPARLVHVSLADVEAALTRARSFHAADASANLAALRDVVVATPHDVPVRVRDLAVVETGRAHRTCHAVDDGGEVVSAAVYADADANLADVRAATTRAVAALGRELPRGITAVSIEYDEVATIELPAGELADHAAHLNALRTAVGADTPVVFELGDADGALAVRRDDLHVLAREPDRAAVIARLRATDPTLVIAATGTAARWIRGSGRDLAELDTVAAAAERVAATTRGVAITGHAGSAMVGRLEAKIDRTRLARVGLDVSAVELAIRAARDGIVVATLDDRSHPIEVKLRLARAGEEPSVALAVAGGGTVTLGQVATYQRVARRREIVHDHLERWVGVRVTLADDTARAALAAAFARIARPVGTRLVLADP